MSSLPAGFRVIQSDEDLSDSTSNPTVRQLCLDFLDDLKAAKSTVDSYRSRLLGSCGFGTIFGHVKISDLRSFEVYRHVTNLDCSVESKRSWLIVAKVVTKWARESERVQADPLSDTKTIQGRATRDAMNHAEILAINKCSLGHLRRIMWFCWLTGCRPGEARLLTFDDVKGAIAIPAKHKTERYGKSRKIYLSDRAMKLLRYCHANRKPNQIHLFVNGSGEQWKKDSLCQAFRRARKRASVPNKVLYSCRHAFLTQAAKQHPMPLVQKLAGHSRLSTTERYMHFDSDDELANAVQDM